MTTTQTDIIDELIPVTPGSALDLLRRHRPETRSNAQASHEALFAPEHPGEVTPVERFAVAAFVSALYGDPVIAAFYARGIDGLDGGADIRAVVVAEAELAATSGPYGEYPDGPLAAESVPGLRYRPSADAAISLGRLAAALEHAHLLVFRPREASREALERLLEAGWSTTGIVTLSQLVAFLSFQARVVSGLRTLDQKAAA
jgi:CMD domain protein